MAAVYPAGPEPTMTTSRTVSVGVLPVGFVLTLRACLRVGVLVGVNRS